MVPAVRGAFGDPYFSRVLLGNFPWRPFGCYTLVFLGDLQGACVENLWNF